MSKLTKIAAAMPFAHFLGLPSASAPRMEETDDRKQRDDESDEDYAKRMEEQDKKEEKARKAEEEEKDKEAKRADEGDDDVDAEADDKDDEEDGKRAGRAKGARQRERIRCAQIIAAGIKAGRVNQAAVFAFDTSLSVAQAISALGASELDKPKARTGLGERMSTVAAPIATPQAEAPAADDPRAIAQRAIAAAARVRGEA